MNIHLCLIDQERRCEEADAYVDRCVKCHNCKQWTCDDTVCGGSCGLIGSVGETAQRMHAVEEHCPLPEPLW